MFENMHSLNDYIHSLPEPMSVEEQALVSYSNMLDDISIALTEYRLAHDLNQSQLADQLHCSQSLVSAYENGARNISLEKLCALFAGIGKSVSIKIEDASQAMEALSNYLARLAEVLLNQCIDSIRFNLGLSI